MNIKAEFFSSTISFNYFNYPTRNTNSLLNGTVIQMMEMSSKSSSDPISNSWKEFHWTHTSMTQTLQVISKVYFVIRIGLWGYQFYIPITDNICSLNTSFPVDKKKQQKIVLKT